MTGSAPISFNAGAESRDRVSANTSCWFALRRRTNGRPIAPVAPAIRILIALPSRLALRRLAHLSDGPTAEIQSPSGGRPSISTTPVASSHTTTYAEAVDFLR